MSAIDHLIAVAAEFGRAANLDDTTVSWRLFGDSKKLPAIKAGADIQVKRLEKAMTYLSSNWPEGAVWPAQVARPAPAQDAA